MTVGMARGSSADFWNTPRRGVIQDGKFRQNPLDHGGPYRGESESEFAARLADWDSHPYEPPRFIEGAKKARYRVRARSGKATK